MIDRRDLRLVLLACGVALLGCEGDIGATPGGTEGTASTASGGSSSGGQGSGAVGGTGAQAGGGQGGAPGGAGGQGGAPTGGQGGVGGTGGNPGGMGGAPGGAGQGGGPGGMGGGPVGGYDCSAPTGAMGNLTLTQVASSLDSPVLVKSAPDDPDRLYIVEQDGDILIREGGQVLGTAFLDVSGIIEYGGEEGLLGLAFHPNYANNGRFFIHYSAVNSGDSTVMEYVRSANPLVADPSPVQLVLQHFTAQGNHNGGSIELGADGYLYVAFGDGGNQNDPECDAQLTGNLLGKIMRLDVDAVPNAQGYPAAPGNPSGAKYYHVGFRNPWRMSVDACNGDLYIGDVGQGSWEEVSVASTANPVAENMGWPYREGAHNHAASGLCPANPGGLEEPIAEFDHNDGCAVAGGYVYRGSAIPWLRGAYLYSDYCSSMIWIVHYDGVSADQPQELTDISPAPGSISSFGQDGNGEVYVVNHNGVIYRIDPQ